MFRRLIVFALAILLFAGCSLGLFAQETTGERFRKVLAQIDENCRERKIGPYLDPSDPEYRRKQGLTNCDILKLEPRDWRTEKMVRADGQYYPIPERWLSTPEGRFAHSIKLPPPHDKPKNVYRKGMDTKEYFDALCREEGGEHVLRVATGVRALRQDRSWTAYPSSYRNLVFWTRERGAPFGEAPQDHLVQPPWGLYETLGVRLSELDSVRRGAAFRILSRDAAKAPKRQFGARTDDGRYVDVPYVVAESYGASNDVQFAYTWRGVWPPDGPEFGIEGSELIVFRIDSLEVLGFQRSYFLHTVDEEQRDPRITRVSACSQGPKKSIPRFFIQSVLVPNPRP